LKSNSDSLKFQIVKDRLVKFNSKDFDFRWCPDLEVQYFFEHWKSHHSALLDVSCCPGAVATNNLVVMSAHVDFD
jgi:hypothetical protein